MTPGKANMAKDIAGARRMMLEKGLGPALAWLYELAWNRGGRAALQKAIKKTRRSA